MTKMAYDSTRNDWCLCVFNEGKWCYKSFHLEGVWSRVSMCVAGQYEYVADAFSRNVSVFTTSGEHVATVGKKSDSEGLCDNPCDVYIDDVCIDRDGYVYICDRDNRRVLIV